MKKSILNLKGATVLTKNEQKNIKGDADRYRLPWCGYVCGPWCQGCPQ